MTKRDRQETGEPQKAGPQTRALAFLIRVPTGAHVFDLVFSCPPTGADVGKSAIIANIGVWVLMELVQDERGDDYLVFRNDMPPAGCRACGGPYPYCKPSCRMFDD